MPFGGGGGFPGGGGQGGSPRGKSVDNETYYKLLVSSCLHVCEGVTVLCACVDNGDVFFGVSTRGGVE